MNNFNEKITNFRIYKQIHKQNGNNDIEDLATVNTLDFIPFSNDCIVAFDLLRFENDVEYILHLVLESEKGYKNIIYVARYTPSHNKEIDDVLFSSSEGSFKFTLTILEKGTYRISLLAFRPDLDQDKVIHSVSRYYYFG